MQLHEHYGEGDDIANIHAKPMATATPSKSQERAISIISSMVKNGVVGIAGGGTLNYSKFDAFFDGQTRGT